MRADVERRIIEDLLLQQLLLFILIHIPLEEVKRRAGFFYLYWLALSLLFLKDGAEVSILSVVLTALHMLN